MIKGVHVTFFTRHADQMRATFKDKLGLAFSDVGGGWLIFDVANAEVGVHPMDEEAEAKSQPGVRPGMGAAEISFYCDDIETTMRDMTSKGVEFTSELADEGYGLLARFRLADDAEADLYQPRYARKPARAAAPKPSRSSTKSSRSKKGAGGKATPRRASRKKTP